MGYMSGTKTWLRHLCHSYLRFYMGQKFSNLASIFDSSRIWSALVPKWNNVSKSQNVHLAPIRYSANLAFSTGVNVQHSPRVAYDKWRLLLSIWRNIGNLKQTWWAPLTGLRSLWPRMTNWTDYRQDSHYANRDKYPELPDREIIRHKI